jgi:hypothetical protein
VPSNYQQTINKPTMNTHQARRGMAVVGGYFAAYITIGFVYPFFHGGKTLLRETLEATGI